MRWPGRRGLSALAVVAAALALAGSSALQLGSGGAGPPADGELVFPSLAPTVGDAPERACGDYSPSPPPDCAELNGWTSSDYAGGSNQNGVNERMEFVPDPSGSGKVVLRMDVFGDDVADQWGGTRVSAYANDVHRNGSTSWTAFGVYIPVGFQYADTWNLYYQIKDHNFSNASFALELANGSNCSPSVGPRNQFCWVKKIGGEVRTQLMPAQEGHWHYLVQNTRWSDQADGFNKVWFGVDAIPDTSRPPLVSYTGNTLAAAGSTGRENILIYRGAGPSSQHQVAYYCGFHEAADPARAKVLSNCPAAR